VKALFCSSSAGRVVSASGFLLNFLSSKKRGSYCPSKDFSRRRTTGSRNRTIYKNEVITKLNLASRPFRNRTLPYLLAFVLLAVSVGGAILCFAKLRDIGTDNEIAQKDIAEIEVKLKDLNTLGEQVQQEVPPDKRVELVAAHKLVAHKSFGWSRLFSDLERVLPNSVSASRLTVENVFKDGDRVKAELAFAALSNDYQSIAAMIDNMNNSGVFKAELRGQDRQKTERSIYTEYTLHLVYTPNYVVASPAQDPYLTQNSGGNQ